ncbi:transglutaminase domain-containing protein [Limnoglobus roseus]|uniref:transglutaminase domain-containing protein n=1 Tax=Limnoglobus roseus TaxID=2598579 RepID=UPI00143D65BA|nr:transglutaminase domain-containing protein [Limnoglobus roseus]
MRNWVAFACLISFAAITSAEDPGGNIVIRPKGTSPTPPPPEVTPSPEKPGFIVIRPNGSGIKPERLIADDPKPKPKTEKVTPRPYGEPIPISNPKPVDDPKPEPKGDPAKGKLLLETWDAAYLKGYKVGYFHTLVREREANGKTYLYATREHRMTLKRFGQMTEQSTEDATLETPEGQVLTTRMELALGPQQKLILTGRITDGILKTQAEGVVSKAEEVAWPDGALGIAKEATLYKDKKPKAGDTFDYLMYEGRLNRVMKVTVDVKALETIALVHGQKPTPMLRLTTTLHPLKDKDGKVVFRVPPATVWVDAETFEPMRTDQDMPSLGGRLIIVRTTKEAALKTPTTVPDLFDVQSIRLDKDVPNIHEKAGVVYRIRTEEEPEPETMIPQDARQTVKNFDPKTKVFDLHVTAVREPRPMPAGAAKPAGEEYLGSSFFVDWQDANVKRHAAAAVAGLPAGASEWQKAKAIERWVHNNMKAVEFSQAMATAGQVAKTLSGDCTEYAMLSAAMCRANGIPSRTALGLVYAPAQGGKPFLAYHMWFEVYVAGDWVALDATLGKGSVGPGHIKITDAHWHGERTFAPLLPVLRVLMSSPKVDVVSVSER